MAGSHGFLQPISLPHRIIKDVVVGRAAASAPQVWLLNLGAFPTTLYAVLEFDLEPSTGGDYFSLQVQPEDASAAYGFVNLDSRASAEHGLTTLLPRRRMFLAISTAPFAIGPSTLKLFIGGTTRLVCRFRGDILGISGPEVMDVRSAPTTARPFLVSGTAKSGTTWLEAILGAHEQCLVLHEAGLLKPFDETAVCASLSDGPDVLAATHYTTWRPIAPTLLEYVRFLGICSAREVLRLFGAAWGGAVAADRTPGYPTHYAQALAAWPALRVVHITRHPIDALVSLIFHEVNLSRAGRRNGCAIPDVILKVVAGRLDEMPPTRGSLVPSGILFTGGLDHVLQSWCGDQLAAMSARRSFPERVHVLRYEDLQADFTACVRRLFAFMDVDLSDQDFASIARQTSFEVMSGGRRPGQRDDRSFFRNGCVGDHAIYFDAAQTEYLWERVGGVATQFGYDC